MTSRFGGCSQGSDGPPQPESPDVNVVQEQGGVFAVLKFNGVATTELAAAKDAEIRAAVQRCGLKYKPGYCLARYNDPSTPAFFRKNEILIELEEFVLQ
ncbi:hypothetical protein CYMTET_56289 [Cymbomonas tetramitiformis]|uniref:SOUL heme-binding protein n=1 Tax=Cymbomonas tetramitiformis TaxID=36881 RepID=A0AAE0BCE8_9CHLO|nr:hypothetical protein CYMTET_56289 [Cymbomonas tetramitiformis]